MTKRRTPTLRAALFLLGAFAFAFCLGEAIHELGHFLVHRAYGIDVGIRLDPFGGSKILNGSSAPRVIWGVTSLGGPLFNLLLGNVVTLALWRWRRTSLLPLLLWGPLALIQEGVTFSLGMLTPGGDAQLIVAWGVAPAVLISLGILFFLLGINLVCFLLPLVGLVPQDTLGRKLAVVAGGMASFMLIRLLFSALRAPDLLLENTVPLIFALLLSAILVSVYRPSNALLKRISQTGHPPPTSRLVLFSLSLGTGIILLQLATFN